MPHARLYTSLVGTDPSHARGKRKPLKLEWARHMVGRTRFYRVFIGAESLERGLGCSILSHPAASELRSLMLLRQTVSP